jgi:hypothetical protein
MDPIRGAIPRHDGKQGQTNPIQRPRADDVSPLGKVCRPDRHRFYLPFAEGHHSLSKKPVYVARVQSYVCAGCTRRSPGLTSMMLFESTRADKAHGKLEDTITCSARPLRSRTFLRQPRSPSLSLRETRWTSGTQVVRQPRLLLMIHILTVPAQSGSKAAATFGARSALPAGCIPVKRAGTTNPTSI